MLQCLQQQAPEAVSNREKQQDHDSDHNRDDAQHTQVIGHREEADWRMTPAETRSASR